MELPEIIQTEAINHRHIYLYNYKGLLWGCCGRSALLLHYIYPNIPYKDRDISGKGDMLPVMIIDQMTLKHLIGNIPPVEQSNDRMVIELPERFRFLCDNKQT